MKPHVLWQEEQRHHGQHRCAFTPSLSVLAGRLCGLPLNKHAEIPKPTGFVYRTTQPMLAFTKCLWRSVSSWPSQASSSFECDDSTGITGSGGENRQWMAFPAPCSNKLWSNRPAGVQPGHFPEVGDYLLGDCNEFPQTCMLPVRINARGCYKVIFCTHPLLRTV